MPHCFVKQPNDLYAIWSTITDSFLALDCTREEAINEEMSDHRSMDYPGGIEAYKKDMEEEFIHIEKSGIAYSWANDWNGYIQFLEETKRYDILKGVDELGLPRRMKRTISSLKQERYWKWYWFNRAEELEMKLHNCQLVAR